MNRNYCGAGTPTAVSHFRTLWGSSLIDSRSRSCNPFNADPTIDEELEHGQEPEPAFDTALAQRDLMVKVVARVQAKLSPLGLSLFTALIIEEREIEEVMMEESMSRDALYAWRSRLLKAIKREYQSLLSESELNLQSS